MATTNTPDNNNQSSSANQGGSPRPNDGGLVAIGAQLSGLPIGHLVSAPLLAACTAQKELARSISDFILEVGLQPPPKNGTGTQQARKIDFSLNRPVTQADGSITQEKVDISFPLLAIVPIPNLQISEVSVDFEFTVQSQVSSTATSDRSYTGDVQSHSDNTLALQADDNQNDTYNASSSYDCHVTGSVASHKEQTRSSDNSAKYTIHIAAEQRPPSEGMMKLLDILNSACAPRSVTPTAGGALAAARPAAPPIAASAGR